MVAGVIAYYLNHSYKTVGYVVQANEDELLIISESGYERLNKKMPESMTLDKVDDDLLSELSYIYIPKINKFIQSEYQKNNKVKLYSGSGIMDSLPPQIEADLIVKMD
ncbi:hypothetical protein [Bacillus sp. 1P06AnD]|uniref:hypothetical protein n=1 Tax=Bacillus sp. 1P06AnD TaxID=3132208 RepID=UPI0039A0B0C3